MNKNKISSLVAESVSEILEIKEKFSNIFTPHTEAITGFEVSLKLKENARPKFLKPSCVPFALRESVKTQLEDLEARKIIKRVDHSNWASQIVLAPKKNGQIRLFCNYKPTLNPCLEDKIYPYTFNGRHS